MGILRREEREGCSADWLPRKLMAEEVSKMRIERLGCLERAWRMRGSFIVATEPEQARRRWCFWSKAWAEAEKGGDALVLELERGSCIACDMLASIPF